MNRQETLLTNRHPDARGGDAVAIYTSTYDAVGNRLTMQELDGSLVTYAYDQSYQLVHEERSGSYPYSISYEYDALGNRLTQNADGALTTYAYNEANQLVSLTYGSSLTTFTYDAKGNLKQESTAGNLTSYTWDDENRLTGIVYPDSTRETYTYDAQSLRRQKESAAGTVRYLWDGANVLEESDETGVPQVRYLTAPDDYDVIAQQQGGVGSYEYVFDPAGNTRHLVKPEGLVVVSYAYTSFGVELDSGIPDTHYGSEYPTSPSNTFYGGEMSGIYSHTYYGGEYGSLGVGPSYNPYRFGGAVGYYMDALNRHYVRARHLDTVTAKWLSRDPIKFHGNDWNLHRYVSNNPANWVDPSGLQGQPKPEPLPLPPSKPIIRPNGFVHLFIGQISGVTAPMNDNALLSHVPYVVSDFQSQYTLRGYAPNHIIVHRGINARPSDLQAALTDPKTDAIWYYGHGIHIVAPESGRVTDIVLDLPSPDFKNPRGGGYVSPTTLDSWMKGRKKLKEATILACNVGTDRLKQILVGNNGSFYGTTREYISWYRFGFVAPWSWGKVKVGQKVASPRR